MSSERVIRLGLIGAGMFGGDVHARAYADLQRCGISPQLSRVGLDLWARDLAGIRFELVAIATRSETSALRIRQQYESWTGLPPRVFHGEKPWQEMLRTHPDLDVLAVATPDHLHAEVILDGLKGNTHVIAEKPMCLFMEEADQILALARERNRLVAVDMHKRYDPDHLRIRRDILSRVGEPLYGTAYLEEPLEVSTSTFKWVSQSDPFSYVGPHWVDLIWHYYHSKPVSLTAVGQKKRLLSLGIEAYDAVQVRVDYENGMSIQFNTNWITPPEFEGPVNQGHEVLGTCGKVESDQQYRGLRWWSVGNGSHTANTHFTREVVRQDGTSAYVGYGVDSLTVALAAICRVKFFGAAPETLGAVYPTAEDGRIAVAIIQAARIVRDLNFKYLAQGRGAVASARFGPDGITIIDPNRISEGQDAVFQKIYTRPV